MASGLRQDDIPVDTFKPILSSENFRKRSSFPFEVELLQLDVVSHFYGQWIDSWIHCGVMRLLGVLGLLIGMAGMTQSYCVESMYEVPNSPISTNLISRPNPYILVVGNRSWDHAVGTNAVSSTQRLHQHADVLDTITLV